jgi:hypothetical protein
MQVIVNHGENEPARHSSAIGIDREAQRRPQAWLADVLTRIADHKISDLAALLPWNWHPTKIERAA